MENMQDFVIKDGVLDKYTGPGGDVAIPAGVTEIGDSAFKGCANLTSVTIPEGVTEIGGSAFEGCANLTSVTIPEGVTKIGHGAFFNCTSLTSVTIPESVTEIGFRAFYGCPKLANQQGMVIIHGILFEYMGSNRDVTIPEGVTEIGASAFSGCKNLTSVTIPEGVTEIWSRAFACCANLTSVTIPEGVKVIRDSAFDGCKKLTSVTIPEGVTEIGYSAFACCENLTSVTIPKSVTKIGKDAFLGSSPALIAPHIPVSNFDTWEKPKACAGFAKAYLDGWEIDEDVKAGYLKYIKGQKKRLFHAAVRYEELLRVMLAEKMIVRKDIDPLLEECDKQSNISAKAAVLDYAGRNLKPVDPAKEFKLKGL